MPINKKIKIMTGKTTTIVLETNYGNIEMALLIDKAPKTVDNFLNLAKSGFYENTKFHRVIKGFMIQGGDPYTKGTDKSIYGTGGPGYTFKDEINPKSLGLSDSAIQKLESEGYSYDSSLQSVPLVRGTIAMANSGPNTNGSQFFIITKQDTSWLYGRHTGFGKVVSGMDIVDKIENLKVGVNDLPLTPVVINKVTVE